MEKDIEQIEYYYNVLCNYNSFQTFDIYTDAFFDNILSIASVKVIVDSLIEEHPIDDSVFDEHSKSEAPYILDYFSDKGHHYLIAYYIQLYNFWKRNETKDYYSEVPWVTAYENEFDGQVQYFKSDFVRPIVDYIIYQLRNEGGILSVIRRYSERIERFSAIGSISNKKEPELQKDIALYLFDNGYEFYKETDTNNGSIDFQIYAPTSRRSVWQCNKTKFVVEVKKFSSQYQIKRAIIQLRAYMNQIGDSKGCLLIYTTSPLLIATKPNDIHIQIVNVFSDTPSKLKKQTLLNLADD